MASAPSLTDFASTISSNASLIDDFFKSNEAIPRPSFSADGPVAFPCPPEAAHVYQAREAMLDAAKKLYQLALGPIESLFELTLRVSDFPRDKDSLGIDGIIVPRQCKSSYHLQVQHSRSSST